MDKDKITIHDLKFDKKNANKHTEKGNRLLEKSISKLGLGRSILLDKDNNFIAGNGVTEKAGELGFENVRIIETNGKEIIAVKRTDLSINSKKGRELAIADNQTAKAGIEFDFDILDNLASEFDIPLSDWELEKMEFDNEPIEEKEAEEDDYEIPNEIKSDVVLGDLITFEKNGKELHRLLCGDSTDSDSVAKLMNGEKAEILFTSPPYSDMREYNGGKDLSINNIIEFIPTFLPYTEYQVINLGIQRKDNEIKAYWNDYINIANKCGYKLLSWNVWNKINCGSIGNQNAMFGINHEWIFVFGYKYKELNRTIENNIIENDKRNKYCKKINEKIKKRVRNKDGTFSDTLVNIHDKHQLYTVIDCYAQLSRDEFTTKHPATFPVELPSEYIKAMTKDNEIIAESFTGSGTTMVAAHQLNRKCYGLELDEKYCQVIIDRMKKLDNELIIKINDKEYKPTEN